MAGINRSRDQISALQNPSRFGFGPALLLGLSTDEEVDIGRVVAHLRAHDAVQGPLDAPFHEHLVLVHQVSCCGEPVGLYVRRADASAVHTVEICIPLMQYRRHLGSYFSQKQPAEVSGAAVQFLQGLTEIMVHLAAMEGVRQVWMQDEGALPPGIADQAVEDGCFVYPWVLAAVSQQPVVGSASTYVWWRCGAGDDVWRTAIALHRPPPPDDGPTGTP